MCFSVKDEAEVHLPWESEPMRRTSLACLSFEAGSGANATLLQEASGATYIGEANAPAVLFGRVEGARYLGEPPSTRIPDFEVEFEAGSEPEIDTGDYECDEALREEVWFETKVGGVPGWIQGNTWLACPECGGETRFIGQIYDELEQWQGPGEPGLCVGFGDCGLGYLFLCAAECGPRGAAFLWTCG
jgi:hypothetical protein